MKTVIPSLFYSTNSYSTFLEAPSEPVELPADDDDEGDDTELVEDEDELVTFLNI